jgi:hypothetical protein
MVLAMAVFLLAGCGTSSEPPATSGRPSDPALAPVPEPPGGREISNPDEMRRALEGLAAGRGGGKHSGAPGKLLHQVLHGAKHAGRGDSEAGAEAPSQDGRLLEEIQAGGP